MAAVPIEKDALDGPRPIEILAQVAAQTGEPDRAIAALQKLLSIPYAGRWLQTCRSLLRCSSLIRCSIRFGMSIVYPRAPCPNNPEVSLSLHRRWLTALVCERASTANTSTSALVSVDR